ncbi:neuronal acetylcholine receptor subunit alpha-7-like [Acanthaster planci]|uniref:Neuronal acetylcholine receptor subunit alpha-7-like n=1 Tax=Acanthaster planci TaxID=133434 RepID=A0A8B7ZHQ9_ACAPL|nr:neuronal acetylcholine receptor subunit alpha-7-like [Acanthaster planci]
MLGPVNFRMMACTAILTVLVLPYLQVAFAKDSGEPHFVNDTDQSQVGWHERQLVSRLLDSERFPHRALTLPADQQDLPLTVEIGMMLQQIMNVYEKDQILIINAWLNYGWTDPTLAWNQSHYGGVKNIRLPPSHLWTPDVLLYNSADDGFDATYHTNVLINSSGYCVWIPPGILRSTCQINVEYFPFDEQICTLKFSSWTYDGFALDLISKNDSSFTDSMTENGEWEMLSMWAVREVEPFESTTYVAVTFKLHIRRRSLYYFVNVLIPCVLISMLTVLSFSLPPDSGEKLSFGVTILLSLTVFMMIVASAMPETSFVIPLIAKYFTCVLVLVALSVVCTVISLNLHFRNPNTHSMHGWLHCILLDYLPWILRMTRPGREIANPCYSKHVTGKPKKDFELMERSPLRNRATGLGEKATRNGIRTGNCHGYLNSTDAIGVKYANYATGTGGDGAEVEPMLSVDHKGCTGCTNKGPILEELRFLTNRYRKKETEDEVISDWKFAAMVVDRLCLVVFSIATLLVTFILLCTAPNFGK